MTFEEQFEQLQKMFDSSDCDIEVLPPDEEKAKKLRAASSLRLRRYSQEPAEFP